MRLSQLAKKHQLTYSRYADDITFSTSQRAFPSPVAAPVAEGDPEWQPGPELTAVITKAGFAINPGKTRMQFRMSRQLVTGLTVNDKVNIRPEYYRRARAMCHELFEKGTYYRPSSPQPAAGENDEARDLKVIDSLAPLEGTLSHIHYVKNAIDHREEPEKRKNPTAARRLYARFLKYRYFVRLERPLIVCEGKTDSIYLKYAIRKLTAFHPKLGSKEGDSFKPAVAFFNYAGQAHKLLELGGGASDLKYFFIKTRYAQDIQRCKHRPLAHPVIVLIDNDNGAGEIFSTLKKNFGITVDLASVDPFFHVTDNLYLVNPHSPSKSLISLS